jgi:hypothetical protein
MIFTSFDVIRNMHKTCLKRRGERGGIKHLEKKNKNSKINELKEYKLIKLGLFAEKEGEDVFVGDTSIYKDTLQYSDTVVKELNEEGYMSISDLENYINTMAEDGWQLESIQYFYKSKTRQDNTTFVMHYALFAKNKV